MTKAFFKILALISRYSSPTDSSDCTDGIGALPFLSVSTRNEVLDYLGIANVGVDTKEEIGIASIGLEMTSTSPSSSTPIVLSDVMLEP